MATERMRGLRIAWELGAFAWQWWRLRDRALGAFGLALLLSLQLVLAIARSGRFSGEMRPRKAR